MGEQTGLLNIRVLPGYIQYFLLVIQDGPLVKMVQYLRQQQEEKPGFPCQVVQPIIYIRFTLLIWIMGGLLEIAALLSEQLMEDKTGRPSQAALPGGLEEFGFMQILE